MFFHSPNIFNGTFIRQFFFIVSCCFFFSGLNAQHRKLDSLLGVMRDQRSDSEKVKTQVLLSRELYLTGRFDSAMLIATEGKTLAQKINYKKGLANCWNNIGNIYWSEGKDSLALKSHLTSMKIQQEIGYMPGVASSLNGMGNIYFRAGNYPEALQHYLDALGIYKKSDTTQKMIRTNMSAEYNNIGNIYFLQENYADALANYFQAKKIREEIDDKHGLAATVGNIGLIYYTQKKYAEALKYHQLSLQLKEQIDDQPGIAATYGNIGAVYYAMGNDEEALKNFIASEKLAEQIGDQAALANACSNIGQSYVRLGRSAAAYSYLRQSLLIGKTSGDPYILENSYNGLAKADSATKQWDSAFVHYQLYILNHDSLQNDENTKKIARAQLNFDFQQRELKLQAAQDKMDAQAEVDRTQKEEERKREKLRNWFIASSLILMMILSLILFNRYRLKRKSEYQQMMNEQQKEKAVAVMETQEQERKRIVEDLHDSLGHLLSAAKFNLQTLPDDQKHLSDNSLALLNQASQEIRNITFNLMPRTLEEEGLIPALNELASRVTQTGKIKMTLQVHNMSGLQLEKQSQFNIYRIVQEAVNNILKHADASEVNIQFVRHEDYLSIMVEDDGKGFDTTERKNGRGLRNIMTRSSWLNGSVQIDSSQGRGTTIMAEIPV